MYQCFFVFAIVFEKVCSESLENLSSRTVHVLLSSDPLFSISEDLNNFSGTPYILEKISEDLPRNTVVVNNGDGYYSMSINGNEIGVAEMPLDLAVYTNIQKDRRVFTISKGKEACLFKIVFYKFGYRILYRNLCLTSFGKHLQFAECSDRLLEKQEFVFEDRTLLYCLERRYAVAPEELEKLREGLPEDMASSVPSMGIDSEKVEEAIKKYNIPPEMQNVSRALGKKWNFKMNFC